MIAERIRDLFHAAWDRLDDLFTYERMPAEHRAQWQTARTVRDLGQIGALYLEGKIGSQPAYLPNCGIDEETYRLAPMLARVNRAGFFTNNSQPAHDDDRPDDTAWVLGFTDQRGAQNLIQLLDGSGLTYLLQRACDRRPFAEHGRPQSSSLFSERDIRSYFHDCHPTAVDALVDAVQVVIEDPEPGRDDRVWPLLEAYADREESESSRWQELDQAIERRAVGVAE